METLEKLVVVGMTVTRHPSPRPGTNVDDRVEEGTVLLLDHIDTDNQVLP